MIAIPNHADRIGVGVALQKALEQLNLGGVVAEVPNMPGDRIDDLERQSLFSKAEILSGNPVSVIGNITILTDEMNSTRLSH